MAEDYTHQHIRLCTHDADGNEPLTFNLNSIPKDLNNSSHNLGWSEKQKPNFFFIPSLVYK